MPLRTTPLLMCLACSFTALLHVQAFSSSPIALSQRKKTSLSYASRERSCIELTDPETGCEVVLVGCFHGSPSSAKDVQREVETSPTDVVALELCASRFADLRKMMETSSDQGEEKQQKGGSPRLIRFVQLVIETIQQRGLSTGVATGVLGGVSGLQTALSGFTPGLEFITAVEAAQKQQQQQQHPNMECDIILADQSVDETVEKVGQLPRVIRSMLKEVQQQNVSNLSSLLEETQWGKMASHLRTALTGDPKLLEANYQVNVGSVVTRNQAVILEMSRLMIPPVVITQMALILINQALFPETMLDTRDGFMTMLLSFFWNPLIKFDPLAFVLDAIPHVMILSFMLTSAYSLLLVPVTQVILAERDDQLTRGIQAACQIASSKHDDGEEGSKGRVVAVLGLLHVNGVAKRLLASGDLLQSNEEIESTVVMEAQSLEI